MLTLWHVSSSLLHLLKLHLHVKHCNGQYRAWKTSVAQRCEEECLFLKASKFWGHAGALHAGLQQGTTPIHVLCQMDIFLWMVTIPDYKLLVWACCLFFLIFWREGPTAIEKGLPNAIARYLQFSVIMTPVLSLQGAHELCNGVASEMTMAMWLKVLAFPGSATYIVTCWKCLVDRHGV